MSPERRSRWPNRPRSGSTERGGDGELICGAGEVRRWPEGVAPRRGRGCAAVHRGGSAPVAEMARRWAGRPCRSTGKRGRGSDGAKEQGKERSTAGSLPDRAAFPGEEKWRRASGLGGGRKGETGRGHCFIGRERTRGRGAAARSVRNGA